MSGFFMTVRVVPYGTYRISYRNWFIDPWYWIGRKESMRRQGHTNERSRSFLTSERPDDSNATPPKTISFFWVPTEVDIAVPGAGVGAGETPV